MSGTFAEPSIDSVSVTAASSYGGACGPPAGIAPAPEAVSLPPRQAGGGGERVGSGTSTGEPPPGTTYELFSILMHRGSATAGHYFAYIRDLATRSWYKFDDSSVSHLASEDLIAAIGGEGAEAGASGGGGATAYLVMYRRVDASRASGEAATGAEIPAGAPPLDVSLDVPDSLRQFLDSLPSAAPVAAPAQATGGECSIKFHSALGVPAAAAAFHGPGPADVDTSDVDQPEAAGASTDYDGNRNMVD